ncbi:DUF3376 domain-containing protein [Paramicrobacterium fandaimingii]|uniref:DUF3376 domain-containing protein n=1 Tax=Paramicrobacterium fandaimingii TaxID=2708079 RepID=UPI00141E3EF2|nr:DUF3376 domain-containing protein [Microbacterium fandaimingii]
MAQASGQVVALGVGSESRPHLVSVGELGDGPHRHVLRVALALRGGVSLAVWIGGAVAELDVARRVRIRQTSGGWDAFYTPPSGSTPPALDTPEIERAREYGRLLAAAAFDSIEIDVIAGASAGGLNAVVYAVAQRAGASVNPLLETWQDAADIRQLLQPPGFSRVDSLLRGDYYFWPRVTRALHDLYDDDLIPHNDIHRSGSVSIDLAATIIDSADRSVPGARDSRGYFHFVGSDSAEGADRGRGIPSDIGDGTDLARLAYAARSTSSYPGAFEPALIFSSTKNPSEKPEGDATHIDMSYAFSGHRPTWNHPFRVIDGSILDEVPIDQAFRAARRSASATSSSRLMLYLDPSPPAPSPRTIRPTRYGPPEPPHGPLSVLRRFADRQSRILNVLRFGGGSADDREPGAEEIAHIERFRLALLREQARGDAYAAAQTTAHFDGDAARRAYVRYRASADVQFLSTVTADPSAWQNSANIDSRSVWRTWDGAHREDLEHAARERYSQATEHAGPSTVIDAITFGPQGVLDAALCGLTWVRALEQLPPDTLNRGTSIAEIRVSLYRILGSATDARDATVVDVLDAARSGSHPAARAIETWITAQGSTNLSALWSELNTVVCLLREISPGVDSGEAWAHSPFSVFPTRNAGAHDLAPFLAPRGIPEPISSLTFERLTADEPPAHGEQFQVLVRRRQRRRARIALSLDPADVTDESLARLFTGPTLGAEDKLSGSLLFNFGGFLSRTWRANDWWWGRLDSSAAIVRILNERSVCTSAAAQSRDSVDAVQSSLFAELASSPDAPLSGRKGPRSVPEIRKEFEFGADTLDNLTPHYRLAIASRALRISSRALSSSIGPVGRVLVALARPIAVAAPLVTTPLRAAGFGAIIGLAVAVIMAVNGTAGPTRLAATWPAHVISAVIICASIAGFLSASRRWRHVIRGLHHVELPLPSDTIADMVALRSRARSQGGALCAMAVATTFAASIVVVLRGLDSTWWILVASATAIAIHGRVRSLDPSATPRPAALYATGSALFAVWAAVIICLPLALGPLQLDNRWVTPLTIGTAGALSSALLTVGWLKPAWSFRGILSNPLSTSVLSALVGAIPAWIATRIAQTPFPVLTTISTVILAIGLWGTALWWLPEVPPGPHDRQTENDARRPAAV